MVGREREQHELLAAYDEDEAQLIAVYGRRRVGKTYLVRETFRDRFYFQHAWLAKGFMSEQLSAFRDSLIHAGAAEVPELHNWREAFNALRTFIEAGGKRRKKVIFIDEMPWMDTPKSKFVMWFESFWNGWCSGRKDVVFIICGSAASWIVKKVFHNKGGLYNRVTRQIRLLPFNLEVKYSNHPFVIDKNYDRQLRSKAGTFADVTKTRSAVHLTMITSNGLSHTGYWGTVQSEVTLDDLFRP